MTGYVETTCKVYLLCVENNERRSTSVGVRVLVALILCPGPVPLSDPSVPNAFEYTRCRSSVHGTVLNQLFHFFWSATGITGVVGDLYNFPPRQT